MHWKALIVLLACFLRIPVISGQNSLDDLNVIFSHNFESNTEGAYLLSEWKTDWWFPKWSNRQEYLKIVSNLQDTQNPSRAMQWDFPKGSLGPHEGGGQWETILKSSYSEIYFSYDVYFKPGFDFVLGGKLPGVFGGPQPYLSQPQGDEGFSATVMFRENGELVSYVYHHDQPGMYGQSNSWNVYATTGKWHNITMRVVMNTVSSLGGNNDGIIEVYFNGKLVYKWSGYRFRNISSIGTDGILMYSHFGGSLDEWRNTRDEYILIDNVLLYTYKSNFNVPRGNTLSPSNRTINYWRNFGFDLNLEPITPPSAPSSLKPVTVGENEITVSWKDNSTNEDGFILTRNEASAPQYTTEVDINPNDTAFTDNSVKPGTTYIYAVKAVNTAGHSDYSNKSVTASLSNAEKKRVRDGLIAYYNFAYNPDMVAYDVSGVGDPVNLRITGISAHTWNHDGNLALTANNSLISFNPASKIIDNIRQSQEMTIECWIRPEEIYNNGPGRILSIGSSDSDLGFVLDQEIVGNQESKKILYSVRLNTNSTNINGFPELRPDGTGPEMINMHHIVFVRNIHGQETLWVNGEKISEGFRPGSFDTWNNNYYLRLGNENGHNFPWLGTYYMLAVYKRALTENEITVNYGAGPNDNVSVREIPYSIRVFPNPVREIVNIEILPSEYSDVVPLTSLRIIDPQGRIIYSENIFNPTKGTTKSYEVNHLPYGPYIIQILSGAQNNSCVFMVDR